MDKNIFREYDIRGKYPTQINEEVALKWLRNGAQVTDTARDLLSKAGVMKKFHEEKGNK